MDAKIADKITAHFTVAVMTRRVQAINDQSVAVVINLINSPSPPRLAKNGSARHGVRELPFTLAESPYRLCRNPTAAWSTALRSMHPDSSEIALPPPVT